MEYNGPGLLEELLALRSDTWEILFPPGTSEFYTNEWNFDETFVSVPPNSSSFQELSSSQFDQSQNCSFGEFYYPLADELTDSSNYKHDTPPFPPAAQEEYSNFPIMDEEVQHSLEVQAEAPCKMEPIHLSAEVPIFNMGLCAGRKSSNKVKKMDGQPSKNLMAERRRRKRLNDRLSMLRSVVPKISKMDRTSILGDTIDYMKELLERINNLQEEIEVGSSQHQNLMSIFKDVKPNEVLVRNSPKFDVERRNTDTRIEICCAGKSGLLLSTVNTLEALGVEIQHCVISCFNDFSMQASCSEELEQRSILSSEDIKQALFRNAGYGGRCL
ncbi:hypothetical protein RJ640_005965 [Escallonia rubra]|uniref:BHLH domain-containing protein n=1 Tax=Escallonia rubra TaxID=112253 RepID=A0AA88R947_9ASTE|nr:hypothetical protein RJ640_005965 [Escallonia rubra]